MAIHKLRTNQIQTLPDGRYSDGNGLYLCVLNNGTSRYWGYQRILRGKRFHVGLGPIRYMSLKAARKLVDRINEALSEGIHPKTFLASLIPTPKEPKKPSLNDVFEKAIRDIKKVRRWRCPDTEIVWRCRMRKYALPIIGDIPLDKITLKDIVRVVKPIWETKTSTAVYVLCQLRIFLDWADIHGYRTGENPAKWNEKLTTILPSPFRVRKKQPMKAIDIKEMPVLCEKLWNKPSRINFSVLLGILTATRLSEFRLAQWKEFDFENRIWNIPPERRKDRQPVPHRIPLSIEAISLLEKLKNLPPKTKNLFPGDRKTIMCKTMPIKALRDNGYNVTMHGMRSTFRDWAAITRQDWIASEKALSHYAGLNVSGRPLMDTYLRTDMLDERRVIMQKWADYCFKLIGIDFTKKADLQSKMDTAQ